MNVDSLELTDEQQPPNRRIYSDDEIEEIRDELEEYYDDAGGMGIIRHPLVTYLGYDPDSKEMVTKLGRWLEQKRKCLQKALAEKDWGLALMLHEKGSRLGALMEYASQMPDDEYWEEVGDIWCQIENPGQYLIVLPNLFNPVSRGIDKRHLLMNEEERVAFAALPEMLTIYRGCAESNRLGFSWSIDREQGEWFARRCGFGAWNDSGPFLLIGDCRRSDVIAHFLRRDEDEIVINPDDVKIIESDRVGKDSDQPLVGAGEVSDD